MASSHYDHLWQSCCPAAFRSNAEKSSAATGRQQSFVTGNCAGFKLYLRLEMDKESVLIEWLKQTLFDRLPCRRTDYREAAEQINMAVFALLPAS